jgi:hypothetical protein
MRHPLRGPVSSERLTCSFSSEARPVSTICRKIDGMARACIIGRRSDKVAVDPDLDVHVTSAEAPLTTLSSTAHQHDAGRTPLGRIIRVRMLGLSDWRSSNGLSRERAYRAWPTSSSAFQYHDAATCLAGGRIYFG